MILEMRNPEDQALGCAWINMRLPVECSVNCKHWILWTVYTSVPFSPASFTNSELYLRLKQD